MQALIWTKFFVSDSPPNSGVLSTALPSFYSLSGGIFVFTCAFFPYVTLITLSGLQAISHSLEEVSLISKGAEDNTWCNTPISYSAHYFSSYTCVCLYSCQF